MTPPHHGAVNSSIGGRRHVIALPAFNGLTTTICKRTRVLWQRLISKSPFYEGADLFDADCDDHRLGGDAESAQVRRAKQETSNRGPFVACRLAGSRSQLFGGVSDCILLPTNRFDL